jgi:HemY protein
VIELIAECYARTQAWEPLRLLLSGVEGARALTPERHRELLGRALREELGRAGESARLEALKALWDATPPALRGLPELRRAYLGGLARFGADTEVAAQVGNMLKQGWDAGLVEVYGSLGGLDPVAQLATVEQWLNQHGERHELLLAAGRVCSRNRLWGKARSYLDAALRLQPTPDVYLALAKLCEQTKQPEEANLFYRRGLELVAGKP